MTPRRKTSCWVRVDSSAVRRVRYDQRQRRLDLIYASGEPYGYYYVPHSKYRALLEAESKGKFVNREIKPAHPFRKLSRKTIA